MRPRDIHFRSRNGGCDARSLSHLDHTPGFRGGHRAEKTDPHPPGISYLRLVGLSRMGRNGFDSRYTLVGAEHPPDLIARVWTRRSPTFQRTWHGFRIREHQDLRRPQNTPIQMPTRMWVCHTWSASRKRRLDFTTRQSFSKGLALQTVHSHPVVRATAHLPGKHAARLPHSKTVTMTF